jgi:hypothetical protein
LADFVDRCRLAHIQLLAGGTPPLTRPQADAALDLFYFMAGQLEVSRRCPAPSERLLGGKTRCGVATLPSDSRNAFAAMPDIWKATVAEWAGLTPSARQQIGYSYAQIDVVKALRADLAAALDA